MEKKKKIRIKDIAAKAKVSAGTVDRVLHNRGEVNESTRKKVMDIVHELGYQPNLIAKTLATKTSFKIAVIIPDVSDNNPYWEKPLKGIQKAALELSDFNTIVNCYTFNATQENSFEKVMQQVLDEKPSGVVFNPVFKALSEQFSKQLDVLNIPYVYLDNDLETGNKVAYFGQNAHQSGKVAAKIFSKIRPQKSKILIAKLANDKAITRHIRKREDGFLDFHTSEPDCSFQFISIEIDLLKQGEPRKSLLEIFQTNKDISGIFVPGSRVFYIADFLQQHDIKSITVLGYDLIDRNIKYMREGWIDFLIYQNPEAQGYDGVFAIFDHVVSRKPVNRMNESPIHIVINENLDYM